MPSQKTVESVLGDNLLLTSELRYLVTKLVEENCFEWPSEEPGLYPNLGTLGVLAIDETIVRVSPSDYLAYGFLMVYQPDLLTNSVDLAAVMDFEQILQHRMSTNSMWPELYRVTGRISRLWVKSQHIDGGDNLTLFCDSPQTVHQFADIFCDVLSELNLSASAIYTHVRQFVHAQVYLPPLVKALETYCQQHSDVAAELYAYTRKHPFEGDRQLCVAAQSGLNRQDWVSFLPQLQALTQQPQDQVLALSVMFRAQIDTDQQAKQYLELALSCDQLRADVRCHLAKVVQQILRFSPILRADTINQCFSLLNTLAQSESAAVQESVLETIWVIDGFEGERFATFMTALRNSDLGSSLRSGKTNTVDTLLTSSFSGPERWFLVFDALIDQNTINFHAEDFTGSLRELITHSGESLMSYLLPRLIHRQADMRRAANQILSFIDQHASHLGFSADELRRLTSLQQYRLWLIVHEVFRQPSFTIPLLLPLLDSSDELLIELISCQLEIASENYMGQVLQALDSVGHPDHPPHQRVCQRVNAYFEAFLATHRRKSTVNELNPLLTQHTLFQQFDSLRRTSWDAQMHQQLHTDSIADLFKEVLLAKGGGWRNSKTGVTSQLGNFQTTLSLPRFYFLRPSEMDIAGIASSFTEEWTDDTDLITWITHE